MPAWRRHGRRRSGRSRVVAVLLSGALLLSACGSGGNEGGAGSGEGEITFWDDNAGPRNTPLWEHVIAEFEKAHPEVSVNYVGVPITSAQQKYDTAIAGGGLPDVGSVPSAFVASFSARDALVPLDERLAGSALEGKLVDGFVETMRAVAPDDKLYAIPLNSNLDVLWYRADQLEQAGVEPPETWEEFFQAADAMTARDQGRYGFTIRGGPGSYFQFLAEMYAYSGIDSFFDDSGKSTVNDPANVEAMERITALYNSATPKADVNNDYAKMVAQFGGGSIAMMHHNLGSYADHVKAFGAGNVGAVPLPRRADAGGHTVVSNPIGGISIFRESDNQDAAWKFVEFVASAEMNSYFTEQTGQIPANTDVADDPWLQEQAPVGMAQELLSNPDTTVVPAPYHLPQFNGSIRTEMEPLYQKVLLGELSPKEFLDTMAEQLNTARKEWESRQ